MGESSISNEGETPYSCVGWEKPVPHYKKGVFFFRKNRQHLLKKGDAEAWGKKKKERRHIVPGKNRKFGLVEKKSRESGEGMAFSKKRESSSQEKGVKSSREGGKKKRQSGETVPKGGEKICPFSLEGRTHHQDDGGLSEAGWRDRGGAQIKSKLLGMLRTQGWGFASQDS